MFVNSTTGTLVPISGTDPRYGAWQHVAYVANPLPDETPALSVTTFNAVASARAAIAGLDASASQLPNPALLRRPAIRREAQSTSALEGTYAPLQAVLAVDDEDNPTDGNLREIINYVRTAEYAFQWMTDGRPLNLGLMTDLQARLVQGTAADNDQAGKLRDIQVMIGSHAGSRIQDARFIPCPPGIELEAKMRECIDWVTSTHNGTIDPVVAAAMAHYQFETLHPFKDGNGRIGRLLIVLHLMASQVLTEPSLTVSPWFEARRAQYYDQLLAVSARGDWDGWVRFFADGLAASALNTAGQLKDLLQVQSDLKDRVRAAGLRADRAMSLVDFSFSQPIFTVRQVEKRLSVTYARANALVKQLIEIGILRQYGESTYDRDFAAPDVLAVVLR